MQTAAISCVFLYLLVHVCLLTVALRSGVVDRPPSVAGLAVGGTVHRTIRASLCHTIFAFADIPYTGGKYEIVFLFYFCTGYSYVQEHFVLSFLIVHPVLHDAHFEAPSTGQPWPVCATPFLHVHVLAAEWYMSCMRLYCTL